MVARPSRVVAPTRGGMFTHQLDMEITIMIIEMGLVSEVTKGQGLPPEGSDFTKGV
jgi:hypothetical protein